MNEILRKSSQEVEIDHLLAEEFICDPTFAQRFIAACGLDCPGFKVTQVIPEPSLGGEGYGDLRIDGEAGELAITLLVEDKISAGPALRQADRYARYAERLRNEGQDRVWAVLVAPASYLGERTRYDFSINIETVIKLIQSSDEARLAYRRGILDRAIKKKAVTGVRVPDLKLHKLKSDYLEYASKWCASHRSDLTFPFLRESYSEYDSWIKPIRSSRLPSHVLLRHRLWISVSGIHGLVDLIASPATSSERIQFRDHHPDDALFAPFSNEKGVQISMVIPQMRQSIGFDQAIMHEAFQKIDDLIGWYVS